MVALEAWALGKPVLANGRCDVLKGQCLRSNAGLFYESTRSSSEALGALASSPSTRRDARAERPAVFPRHYDWPVIERKYLDMFEQLAHEAPTASRRRWRRCPAGSRAADRTVPAARDRSSRACRQEPGAAVTPPLRVHQVLATLGYGDAIGHEVLGIQRVLRGAGLRVGDLRRDRRSAARGADAATTASWWTRASPTTCCSIISRSARRPRARPTRCPIGWRSSTTTSRRRSTSSASTSTLVRAMLPGPPRASARTSTACDLALGDSEFNRQDLTALGFPRTRRCCRSSPTSRTSTGRPTGSSPPSSTTTGRTSCSSAASSPNKKIEDLIRFFHAYQTRFNPRSRLLLVGAHSGFERYLAALHAPDREARRHATCTSSATCPTRSWSPTTTSPTCSSAPASTKASACRCRGVLQAGAGARLRRHGGAGDDGRRRRAVRGPAIRIHVAGARSTPIAVGRRAPGSRSSRHRTPRSAGWRPRTSPARSSRFVEQIARVAARAARRSVAFDFWDQFDAREELEELRHLPAVGDLQGACRSAVELDDRQPVGAGGAPRRRDRRQRAPRRAICCAALGHESELYALTIDDDLRERRAAVRRPDGARAATSRSSTSRCRRR